MKNKLFLLLLMTLILFSGMAKVADATSYAPNSWETDWDAKLRNLEKGPIDLRAHIPDSIKAEAFKGWDQWLRIKDFYAGKGVNFSPWEDFPDKEKAPEFIGREIRELERCFADGKFGFGVDRDCQFCFDRKKDTDNSSPVPEPATMILLGSGLIGIAGFRRKAQK